MKTRIASFLGVLFLGVCPLFAAVDAFMKFDGISGESKTRTGWIEIESFSFGASQGASHGQSIGSASSGGGAGKVAVHDISITKKVDKASPMLTSASLAGKHFPTVTIDVHRQHYVFENVMITSVQRTGQMGDGSVREVIKMSYVRDAIHDPPVTADAAIGGVTTAHVAVPAPNATFGGGVTGAANLQSLRLVGQTQAIIVVCDVNGGQTVGALQRASQSRQPMPTLTIRANPKQAGQPYLQFTMTTVLISGVSMAPGGCSQVTFHFSKFDGPPSGY